MSYITILGRQPEFGLVELESLLGAKAVTPFGVEAAIIPTSIDLNRLGGSQKLGRIIYEGATRNLNETPMPLNELPTSEGKTTFGISMYGVKGTTKFVMATGLTLKKRLRAAGGSVRLVSPQTGTHLTAAQVKFNGLTRNGFELLVVQAGSKMVIAVTEQVQDIDAYAARDYARPTRSAKVGMLPPKLTQIMINTTSAPLVYDPFCGTGVVLQEALLLGRKTAGSDLVPSLVTATNENVTWLRERLPNLPAASAVQSDAQLVQLPKEKLAIVSEGYLGPNQSKQITPGELTPIKKELLQLYSKSLRNWHTQLPKNGEVTITAPVWRTTAGWQALGIIDQLPDMGYSLRSFEHSDSAELIYRRPKQIVGRQLLVLRKA